MDDRELSHFRGDFPKGGYFVPDTNKNGAYFIQGRAQFFMFFTKASHYEKCVKIPGDIKQKKFCPGFCNDRAKSVPKLVFIVHIATMLSSGSVLFWSSGTPGKQNTHVECPCT
jgi:hypothetical protein